MLIISSFKSLKIRVRTYKKTKKMFPSAAGFRPCRSPTLEFFFKSSPAGECSIMNMKPENIISTGARMPWRLFRGADGPI